MKTVLIGCVKNCMTHLRGRQDWLVRHVSLFMDLLLPNLQKIPMSKLPYTFRKRLISLAPLRIVDELSKLCQNVKKFRLFHPKAYDHVFITNNNEVYKWALTDTFLFRISKILYQFAFFRFLFDGMDHTNPIWESVVHVRDIRRTKRYLYVEDTLVLYCNTPNIYDYVIPYICGPYTRLILHGNIRGDQVLRLIHPGVKRVRINATVQMPTQEYGHFAEFLASQFHSFNSSFVLFITETVTDQLRTKLREAWARHNHEYLETSGPKGRICIANGCKMYAYCVTITMIAIFGSVAIAYITDLLMVVIFGESCFLPIFIAFYIVLVPASVGTFCYLAVLPLRTDEITLSE